MAHGDARKGKWRRNWWMEWVASTLHTTSEHGVSSITNADAHTSAASSRLNWRPFRFKWTRLFRRQTKSDFCACAITFQTQSTYCQYHVSRRLSSTITLLKRNWGSPSCRGWGLPSWRVWSQPPTASSCNSLTWDSPRARRGPEPLAGTCNTIEMNADHCGTGNSQMVPEWHQVTWHLTVGISLVTVGKPHLTVLVGSVGWKWTRNGVCFTALRFNSISVRTKRSKSGSTILEV